MLEWYALNNEQQIKYWISFQRIQGIGKAKMALLEQYFGSLEKAWHASAADLKVAGLDSHALKKVAEMRPTISPDDEIASLNRMGITALTYHDAAYPTRLKEIYDYPPVIYLKGSFAPDDKWCISIVGTRKATIYGKQVTAELTADLAACGLTIVSGLARGIDSVAHRSALEAGGRTIAVFACGLDMVYPAENASLARQIIQNGVLISEYPPGTRPKPEYFPRRNRIISGLSLGVLVTEAQESSGAGITASCALEQNREVFAVPGSILAPASRGTNRLIQEGAKLVLSHTDILEELNITTIERQLELGEMAEGASESEKLILSQLSGEPMHIDEICRSSSLPPAEVSSGLTIMELRGMVKQIETMKYVLARETRQEYKVTVDR